MFRVMCVRRIHSAAASAEAVCTFRVRLKPRLIEDGLLNSVRNNAAVHLLLP